MEVGWLPVFEAIFICNALLQKLLSIIFGAILQKLGAPISLLTSVLLSIPIAQRNSRAKQYIAYM